VEQRGERLPRARGHIAMNGKKKVAVLVGSLRKASLTRKLALAIRELAPDSLELDVVEIGALPFYNEDLETDDPPKAWKDFRAAIRAADAVLFVTPEYNRSMPATIKNAIDVGSRPYGHSVWGGKPGAVVSQSPGQICGFGANHHLRQTFVFVDVRPMQQPEAYIGQSNKLFDEQGRLANDDTKQFLRKFMESFARWIEQLSR
jgi:chromate reductase